MENNMKIFAVITVARQDQGEYICIRTEKAFTQASKADDLLKQLKKQYLDNEGKTKGVRIDTPSGPLDCVCEVGAFEIEVEE
jgi:hypothetical protein